MSLIRAWRNKGESWAQMEGVPMKGTETRSGFAKASWLLSNIRDLQDMGVVRLHSWSSLHHHHHHHHYDYTYQFHGHNSNMPQAWPCIYNVHRRGRCTCRADTDISRNVLSVWLILAFPSAPPELVFLFMSGGERRNALLLPLHEECPLWKALPALRRAFCASAKQKNQVKPVVCRDTWLPPNWIPRKGEKWCCRHPSLPFWKCGMRCYNCGETFFLTVVKLWLHLWKENQTRTIMAYQPRVG